MDAINKLVFVRVNDGNIHEIKRVLGDSLEDTRYDDCYQYLVYHADHGWDILRTADNKYEVDIQTLETILHDPMSFVADKIFERINNKLKSVGMDLSPLQAKVMLSQLKLDTKSIYSGDLIEILNN